MLKNKRKNVALPICYRIGICLFGAFAILLLLIPYAEAAPPSGGVSPTPLPAVTSTVVNLSVTKEALSPSDSTSIVDMPTALPAPATAATPNNAVISSPLDVDVTIISSDETSDAVAANQQDDEWRANAAAQGLSFCSRGRLSESDPNKAGIYQTIFANGVSGPSASYELREIRDSFLSDAITGEANPPSFIQHSSFMKGSAPIPQELLDMGEEAAAAFEEQAGSASDANGLLVTFGPPGVQAFGAWFGGLGSRSPLEGVGLDGDPRGGKLAYMRLFDADGRQIGPDRAIRPAQKEEQALCLDANGESTECGSIKTRWVGFVASQPIAQMLLVVGDDDDSDQLPACRVEADGGTEADFIAQCQAGDEHLSFVGPTICTDTILEVIAINDTNSSDDDVPLLTQATRDNPMQSLALTGAGLSLIGLFGFLWRKRR